MEKKSHSLLRLVKTKDSFFGPFVVVYAKSFLFHDLVVWVVLVVVVVSAAVVAAFGTVV